MTLPNLLIIGAPKTGTTSLRKILSAHPDIFMPNTKPGEPHYLSYRANAWPSWAVASNEEYERLFAGYASERYVAEKSTWYLYCEGAGEVASETLNQCRAVALLRDPVARAFSHYTYNRSNGWEPHASFAKALQWEEGQTDRMFAPDRMYLEAGRYSRQLRRWFDTLGRERLCVVLQDDLFERPEEAVSQIFSFLGISDVEFATTRLVQENTSYGIHSYQLTRLIKAARGNFNFLPRGVKHRIAQSLQGINRKAKPALDPDLARALAISFEHEVATLSALLGVDLVDRWLSQYR